MTRRSFGSISMAAALRGVAGTSQQSPPNDGELRSEFLMDLSILAQPPSAIGADRTIVPVSGGTFEGPRLKGKIVGPSGDWIVERADGSRVLDVRLLLQTDDGEKVLMTWRGIAYSPAGGSFYARILPLFETGAAKYLWLRNVVAVGVFRPMSGAIAYRIHQIL